MFDINKVVLVYFGGLDIFVIVKWLQEIYNCEVVIFIVDIGQGEEVELVCVKVKVMGVKEIYIEDLCEEFVCDYVFLMFCVNVIYEGEYLFGIFIVWLLIVKCLVEIVVEIGVDVIFYGVIGKGNDQVCFELGVYVLVSGIQVIVLWCEWDLNFCEKLMQFCEDYEILVDFINKKKKFLYFMDVNLLYIFYEGGNLEDFWWEVEEDMWCWSVSLEVVLDQFIYVILIYEKGDIVVIDGECLSVVEIFSKFNKLGGDNGIGCFDIVENCYVGMKFRGCYEIFGGIIMLFVYCVIELLILDCEFVYLKDLVMFKYVELLYNGYWWFLECLVLQKLIDVIQENVNGEVCMKLYKGVVIVVGCCFENDSLFDVFIVIFEDDVGVYDQKDVEGFIKFNVLCLCIVVKNGCKLF